MKIQPGITYPQIISFVTRMDFQVGVVLLTLFLVIYYSVAYYLYVPLTGVWLNYVDSSSAVIQIDRLDPDSPGDTAGLKQGDKIISIDGRAIANLNSPIHHAKKAGEQETYVIERDGKQRQFSLIVGDYFQHPKYLLDIVPAQLLSLLVYALGLILFLFSTAQDIRARLVGLTWLLSGVSLVVVLSGYPSCAWFSGDLTIVSIAVTNFFSLAAHLYFPAASFSNRTRRMILWCLLGLSLVLLAAYIFQAINAYLNNFPPELSRSAKVIEALFALVWLVNIGLLIKNRFITKDKEIRRQTNIVLIGTIIGFMPFLLLTLFPYLLLGPPFMIVPSNISTLSLLFVPLSYSYVIYQRRLLKIDLLINRALVLFILVLLILFSSATVFGIIAVLLSLPSQVAVIGGILCVIVALSAARMQKGIQIQVDRVLYGGYYDFSTVTARSSNRLWQITDRRDFNEVLTVEFAQQMQVEKSALLMVSGSRLAFQDENEPLSVATGDDEICKLLVHSHLPLRAPNLWALVSPKTAERWAGFNWAQVFAPLVHRETLYGILVFGDRLNGNLYSNQDMEIINTTSQQAALAIANVAMVESLRGLAQQLVRTDEEQRRVMSRELHDDVLQNLFFIQTKLAKSKPLEAAQLQKTVAKLRQTVKAQRPSLLDQGIVLALQDLINDLNQLAGDKTIITLRNLLLEPIALDDEKTTALYRIVQEALSNVLKHADADEVVVTLKMDHDLLQIEVADNGIGIENTNQAQSGHYGLLGMSERATMIGGALNITSDVDNGTTVSISLKLMLKESKK